jgi:hypothetical protein
VFHKTSKDAALHLGIGVETLKKIQSRFGIKRWPSREIQAVRRMLLYYQEVGPAEDVQFLQ